MTSPPSSSSRFSASFFAEPEFLQGLRRICDEHGIVLIFDEVVTGFRLALGGGQEHFGVTPDLASYGKIVGGGGPLACVAGRADIIEGANPARKGSPDFAYINGTLHGNPIAAAAGLATIAELEAPGFYDDLAAKSGPAEVPAPGRPGQARRARDLRRKPFFLAVPSYGRGAPTPRPT